MYCPDALRCPRESWRLGLPATPAFAATHVLYNRGAHYVSDGTHEKCACTHEKGTHEKVHMARTKRAQERTQTDKHGTHTHAARTHPTCCTRKLRAARRSGTGSAS